MVYIYILELVENKYYVGKTDNPQIRLEDHFSDFGSEWTKLHKPLKVSKIIPDCDNYDEDKITLQTMSQYGIDNVRGGSFTQINLNKSTQIMLEKMIRNASDVCYKCGSKTHFVKDCDINNRFILFSDDSSSEGSSSEDSSSEDSSSEDSSSEGSSSEDSSSEGSSSDDSDYSNKFKNIKKTNPLPRPQSWVSKPVINHKNIKKTNPLPRPQIWVSKPIINHKNNDNYTTRKPVPSRAKELNLTSKKHNCFRCGRDNHYASDCYAKVHSKGYKL